MEGQINGELSHPLLSRFVAVMRPSGILQTARVTHLKNNEMAKDVRCASTDSTYKRRRSVRATYEQRVTKAFKLAVLDFPMNLA
jgi:hypothetical protein